MLFCSNNRPLNLFDKIFFSRFESLVLYKKIFLAHTCVLKATKLKVVRMFFSYDQ